MSWLISVTAQPGCKSSKETVIKIWEEGLFSTAAGRATMQLWLQHVVLWFTFYLTGKETKDYASLSFPIISCSWIAVYLFLICANKTVRLCCKMVKETREHEGLEGNF